MWQQSPTPWCFRECRQSAAGSSATSKSTSNGPQNQNEQPKNNAHRWMSSQRSKSGVLASLLCLTREAFIHISGACVCARCSTQQHAPSHTLRASSIRPLRLVVTATDPPHGGFELCILSGSKSRRRLDYNLGRRPATSPGPPSLHSSVVKCVSTVEKNGIFKNQSGGAGALFSPSLRAPVLLGHCYAALIPHCPLEPPALPLPPFPAGGKTPTQEEPENPQHDCDKGATTPLLTHGLLRRLGDSACVSGPGCTRAAAPCAASRRRIRPRCERASA